MIKGFKVDGITYDVAVGIHRKAVIRSSEVSGYLLNGNYHNDVLGTYFEYTVNIAVPLGKEARYATLYEVLSNPRASHTFVFPYNQSTIQIEGRVQTIDDDYVWERGGVRYWRAITFKVIANEPSKTA